MLQQELLADAINILINKYHLSNHNTEYLYDVVMPFERHASFDEDEKRFKKYERRYGNDDVAFYSINNGIKTPTYEWEGYNYSPISYYENDNKGITSWRIGYKKNTIGEWPFDRDYSIPEIHRGSDGIKCQNFYLDSVG